MWLTDEELAAGAAGQGARTVRGSRRSDMTEPEVLDAPRAPRSSPSDSTGRTPPVAHILTPAPPPIVDPRRTSGVTV
jgi:hypothetical protein